MKNLALRKTLTFNFQKQDKVTGLFPRTGNSMFSLKKRVISHDLIIANRKLAAQRHEKEERTSELRIANDELGIQHEENGKRSNELILANWLLKFQKSEKEKRAAELLIANDELAIQNKEKEKRAVELSVAYEELKKAEQSIEFERNNFKSLINNTRDLMWSVDKDFRLIASNQAFGELVKYTTGKEVNIGNDVRVASANQQQADRFESYYKRAFTGETFTEVEYNELPEEFWSEMSFYPMRHGDEIIGTACFSRNITLKKKEEIHLMLLESVVTNTSDSVLIMDTVPERAGGPHIIYANDAFTRLTGYSKEEVLGKQPFFLLGPKSDQYEFERLSNSMRLSKPCEIEILQYKKNREEFWVNLELVQIKDTNGKPTHYIAIERDITAHINGVNSIREQNVKLKEIARMQSHDVRGPLARILGLTNLMINHPLEEDRQRILDLLLKSSDELDKIITKIIQKTQTVQ